MMKRLFNLSGRANRAEFWAANVRTQIAMFVLMLVLFEVTGDALPGSDWLYLAAWSAFMAPVAVRRFHDRSRSGWLLTPWAGLVAAMPLVNAEPQPVSMKVLALVLTAAGFWITIECYALPGTKGENRFGPVRGPSL